MSVQTGGANVPRAARSLALRPSPGARWQRAPQAQLCALREAAAPGCTLSSSAPDSATVGSVGFCVGRAYNSIQWDNGRTPAGASLAGFTAAVQAHAFRMGQSGYRQHFVLQSEQYVSDPQRHMLVLHPDKDAEAEAFAAQLARGPPITVTYRGKAVRVEVRGWSTLVASFDLVVVMHNMPPQLCIKGVTACLLRCAGGAGGASVLSEVLSEPNDRTRSAAPGLPCAGRIVATVKAGDGDLFLASLPRLARVCDHTVAIVVHPVEPNMQGLDELIMAPEEMERFWDTAHGGRPRSGSRPPAPLSAQQPAAAAATAAAHPPPPPPRTSPSSRAIGWWRRSISAEAEPQHQQPEEAVAPAVRRSAADTTDRVGGPPLAPSTAEPRTGPMGGRSPPQRPEERQAAPQACLAAPALEHAQQPPAAPSAAPHQRSVGAASPAPAPVTSRRSDAPFEGDEGMVELVSAPGTLVANATTSTATQPGRTAGRTAAAASTPVAAASASSAAARTPAAVASAAATAATAPEAAANTPAVAAGANVPMPPTSSAASPASPSLLVAAAVGYVEGGSGRGASLASEAGLQGSSPVAALGLGVGPLLQAAAPPALPCPASEGVLGGVPSSAVQSGAGRAALGVEGGVGLGPSPGSLVPLPAGPAPVPGCSVSAAAAALLGSLPSGAAVGGTPSVHLPLAAAAPSGRSRARRRPAHPSGPSPAGRAVRSPRAGTGTNKRAGAALLDEVLAPVAAAAAALHSSHPRAGVGYTSSEAGSKRRRMGDAAPVATAAAAHVQPLPVQQAAAGPMDSMQQPSPLPDTQRPLGWSAVLVARREVRSYAGSSAAYSDMAQLKAAAAATAHSYGLNAGPRKGIGSVASVRRGLAAPPGPHALSALAAQSSRYSLCAEEWGRVAVAGCMQAKYGSLWALERDLLRLPHQRLQQPQQQQHQQLSGGFMTELHFVIQQLQPVFERISSPQRELRRAKAGAGTQDAGAGAA